VEHVWQRRFYDFVVFTEKKCMEKLRYNETQKAELHIRKIS
jgi:hypothetical protein